MRESSSNIRRQYSVSSCYDRSMISPQRCSSRYFKVCWKLEFEGFWEKVGEGRGVTKKIVLKPKIIMNLLGQNFGLRKPQFCISGNFVNGKSYHKKFCSRFCGESCDKKLGMCAFCFPNIKRQDVRVNQNQVISVCLLLLKIGSCAHPTMVLISMP